MDGPRCEKCASSGAVTTANILDTSSFAASPGWGIRAGVFAALPLLCPPPLGGPRRGLSQSLLPLARDWKSALLGRGEDWSGGLSGTTTGRAGAGSKAPKTEVKGAADWPNENGTGVADWPNENAGGASWPNEKAEGVADWPTPNAEVDLTGLVARAGLACQGQAISRTCR